MSSIQSGQLFVSQAFKNCFNQLVPDMKKFNGQYTEQDQDAMTNCLVRYIDSFRTTQKVFYQTHEQE
ncbi:unnamed protein product [Paramecium primaurelia]|uniref:Mitochondrial import inner membrane translocase subunit n=4 Tax=Paramecium TaxID=5884 RepID=A0CCL7_PARTE|nr:uncharacterized protein GSPATT00037319001 [Paramecium tetraurelia]CAD8112218.1 unnamed protein product [Paramecium primaurelia]CAD8162007.1 unnamed protein product [Paramecium octaurelia]CAD8208757.1 unnamed protein product [Paramecium pentaurelia]CAD8209163.1 unnamed protein product [Paramecium pentaurelia]CAD8213480.1 unnamed protein product [Paramecium octaurelia]|eukprot:XP_001435931.1 hypothetical protein (macronuclear) [Paramecium tetraurelia strain d4-2]